MPHFAVLPYTKRNVLPFRLSGGKYLGFARGVGIMRFGATWNISVYFKYGFLWLKVVS